MHILVGVYDLPGEPKPAQGGPSGDQRRRAEMIGWSANSPDRRPGGWRLFRMGEPPRSCLISSSSANHSPSPSPPEGTGRRPPGMPLDGQVVIPPQYTPDDVVRIFDAHTADQLGNADHASSSPRKSSSAVVMPGRSHVRNAARIFELHLLLAQDQSWGASAYMRTA